MSVTLSNGYKNPENGDLGSSWFPDLNFNIARLNDHSHNGTDSNKLNALSFSLLTDSIVSGDFTLQTDIYRALKELPAGGTVDGVNISFRDATTKNKIYMSIEKVSSTSFYVYSIVPRDIEVVYG